MLTMSNFMVRHLYKLLGHLKKRGMKRVVMWHDMLERSGFATFVGGNLGVALSEAVGSEANTPDGRIVVELSSFQLERVDQLRVNAAALLNVREDGRLLGGLPLVGRPGGREKGLRRSSRRSQPQ